MEKTDLIHQKTNNFKLRTESELIGEVYEAIMRPEGYKQFLQLLCHSLNCQSGTLVVANVESGEFMGGWVHGIEQKIITHYFEKGLVHNDPLIQAVFKSPIAQYQTLHDMGDISQYKGIDSYEVWAKSLGIFDAAGAIIAIEGTLITILSFQRNIKQSYFEDHHIEQLNRLTPHIQRSLTLYTRFQEKSINQQPLSEALNKFSQPTIVFNVGAKIIYVNNAAKNLTDHENWISINKKSLHIHNSVTRKTFSSALYDVTLTSIGKSNNSGAVIHTGNTPEAPVLLLQPLSKFNNDDDTLQGGAILFIYQKDRIHNMDLEILKKLFQLSNAEARVCINLIHGLSPKEIATTTNRTENTIRSQIRSVYNKTGTSKSSDLITTLLSSPAFLS